MKDDFINHTNAWVKGEIFEGCLILIYGVSMLILAFYFWKFSQFASTKALALPILIVSLFWSTAGAIGITYNHGRTEKLRVAYYENPDEFIQAEQDRVNKFWVVYRYAIICNSSDLI